MSHGSVSQPVAIVDESIMLLDFGYDDVCMILGDNIFHGNGLDELLIRNVDKVKKSNKATVFGYYVNDPNRYGVLGFDETNKITSIEEKPLKPKSNYAVIGLYFYPNSSNF